MTEAVQIALIVAIAPTIAAITAAVLAIMTRYSLLRTQAAHGQALALADQKLDHITDLTNSTLSQARAQLAQAEQRIADLERTIRELIRAQVKGPL